jgi:hypothetical protein
MNVFISDQNDETDLIVNTGVSVDVETQSGRDEVSDVGLRVAATAPGSLTGRGQASSTYQA